MENGFSQSVAGECHHHVIFYCLQSTQLDEQDIDIIGRIHACKIISMHIQTFSKRTERHILVIGWSGWVVQMIQPDKKHTHTHCKLYVTGNGVVASFIGSKLQLDSQQRLLVEASSKTLGGRGGGGGGGGRALTD